MPSLRNLRKKVHKLLHRDSRNEEDDIEIKRLTETIREITILNSLVPCPVCTERIYQNDIDQHVEACLQTISEKETKIEPFIEIPDFDANAEQDVPSTSFEIPLRASQQMIRDNPFAIACPYPGPCGYMEARDFPAHVIACHSSNKTHKFTCPICDLRSDEPITWPDDHNLMTHLQSAHSDLKPSWEDAPLVLPDFGDVGSNYIEETLSNDIEGKECLICFEDFLAGNKIKRLDCWCIFHKNCIDLWIEKQNNQIKCPVHKRDTLQ